MVLRLVLILFLPVLFSAPAYSAEPTPAQCKELNDRIPEHCFEAFGITERYETLSKVLSVAAKRMGLEEKYTLVVMRSRTMGVQGDMWTMRMPAFPGFPSYAIYVTADFLALERELTFEHAAVHELCHIKRGDPGLRVQPPDVEMQAERCVYNFVGEERYFAFWRDRQGQHFDAAAEEKIRKLFGAPAPTENTAPSVSPAVKDLEEQANKLESQGLGELARVIRELADSLKKYPVRQ